MKKLPYTILGIDPGTLFMGYGIVRICGQELRLQDMNVLKLPQRMDNHERLARIYGKVTELIRLHDPQALAIEAPFFGKNVQSMLKLGRAQGVAIAAAIACGLEVREYAPNRIKQAITGNGHAAKEQVWAMLRQLIQLPPETVRLDASDALAVAVCHHFQASLPDGLDGAPSKRHRKPAASTSAWEKFLQENPGRLRKG